MRLHTVKRRTRPPAIPDADSTERGAATDARIDQNGNKGTDNADRMLM